MSIKGKIFEKIHTSNLVYNTCWEDPRCDRKMLSLDSDSRVVMLTSAGCNALDYALDGPASIDSIDMNSKQNALLELKLSIFKQSDHDTLYRFFGNGVHKDANHVLNHTLSTALPKYAFEYWQKKIHAFEGNGLRKSFYYFGSSGAVAFWFKRFLATDPRTKKSILDMFETEDLDRQRILYYQLEPKLLNRFVRWLLNRHVVQSMLGVPKSQQELAKATFNEGMGGYIRQCFRKVFAQQSLQDNYFWKLYFFGKYDINCCPNYLKKAYFEQIKDHSQRIKTHTNTLSGFLKNHPGQYSHFVLLDHQDWLAANDRPALEEEWRLILANASKGAKILFRSAAYSRHFLPSFVFDRVLFDDQIVQQMHQEDRVGTYASVHFGTIV
jgi:S-adenosylmethionine-diacylglycerol 3-amino-3-carboxypropyl transferase